MPRADPHQGLMPSLLDRLKAKFGDRISGSNLQAIDPWIEVTPAGLVEVCQYLKTEPDLQFNLLNCISGVDYFEPDPKKAAKGTIRADLATSIDENMVHGSDAPETAAREIAYFFREIEICPRTR